MAAPPPEIAARIQALQATLGSAEALSAVLACGPAAIPLLRHELFTGRLESIPDSRRALVEALAGLDAQQVLLDYLDQPPVPADPVCAFAEEAVQSAAARLLADTPRARQVLRRVLPRRCLSGVIEQAGAWRDLDALPAIIRCLASDPCRRAAATALAGFGAPAIGALIDSALDTGADTPSDRLRRLESLKIILDLPLSSAQWAPLRPLAGSADPTLAARAILVGLRHASGAERPTLVQRAAALASRLDWELDKELRAAAAAWR
ncbi:MAG: hypothetical protein ACRD2E_11330 [Terriglobales bacterium]